METSTTTNYDIVTPLSRTETNDCVVRSFMSAFGLPYAKSHGIVEEYLNRNNRDGVQGMSLKLANGDVLKALNNKGLIIKRHNVLYTRKYDGRTLEMNVRRFCKTYPKGTFIIANRTHAWTIKDGEVHDWSTQKEQLQRKCLFAWEVKNNIQYELDLKFD